MNRVLIGSFALSLCFLHTGIATQMQSGMVNTSLQRVAVSIPLEKQAVDFTIDSNTIENWKWISAGDDLIQIDNETNGSIDIDLPTKDNPIIHVSLLPEDGTKNGGADDVLIFGKKNALSFSAESTAKEMMIGFLVFFDLSFDETLTAYDMFPKHPKFSELVTLFENQKGWPVDDKAVDKVGEFGGEIVLEIVSGFENASQ